MAGDRTNVLRILSILEDYSDENHILTATDIINKFKAQYDSTVDRRTVYSAVDALNEIGYDVSLHEENGKGYYLRERKFEPAEIRLLLDAVHSCEYISQKQTDELSEKLKTLLSVYERQNINYGNIINPNKKSANQQVILNIDLLSDAITQKHQISFTYLDFDYDKKLKARREEKYIVNPYAMICENERYYLVCLYKGHNSPSLYRIDMMKDIKILKDPVELSVKEANLNTVKKITYAHAGEPETIRLKCDKIALRYVIEKFGNDVTIIPDRDGNGGFEAVFSAAPQGILYWALQYLQYVEVLSPASLRDAVIKAVEANKYGI